MRNAFVCCTPFHVLISVHLAKNVYPTELNDIYVSDHFGNAHEVYKNIKGTNLFNSVHFVKDKDISYDRSFLKHKKIRSFFNRSIEQDLVNPFPTLKYDKLFLYTYSHFSVLFADLCKGKYNSEINMVEEGIMTYALGNYRSDLIKALLSKVLKGINRFYLNYSSINNIYLFSPNLYSGKCSDKVRKIPPIPINNEFKTLVNRVFNYRRQIEYSESKFIFFDQSFTQDGSDIKEEDVIKLLIELCGYSNLLIKLHPRDTENKYTSVGSYKLNKAPYPWEVIYLNEMLESKILIAVSSSALFTPKIFYNQEPKIILLYKLFKVEVNAGFDKFVDSIAHNYHSDNVYIPDSLEELRDILKY